MHRSLLLLFVVAVLLAPATAGAETAPPAPQRIVGLYAMSDPFWTWDSALLLHVEVAPRDESLGYVRSGPSYLIDCPYACTRPLALGRTVELTAYPSPGAVFASWSGRACAGQGNPCTLTMTADTVVTANFGGHYAPPAAAGAPGAPLASHYALTVVPDAAAYRPSSPAAVANVWSSPAGIANCSSAPIVFSLGATCSASFPTGTTVTLTNSPNVCTRWTWGGAGTTGPGNTRVVVMNGDRTVTVTATRIIC